MSFSIWFKQILFSYGITQRFCGKSIDEDETLISRWALGRRHPDVVQVAKIAEFLAEQKDVRGFEDERRALILTMVDLIKLDKEREEKIDAVL
jgi:transcriptional regulator with XRE-family HTH domain